MDIKCVMSDDLQGIVQHRIFLPDNLEHIMRFASHEKVICFEKYCLFQKSFEEKRCQSKAMQKKVEREDFEKKLEAVMNMFEDLKLTANYETASLKKQLRETEEKEQLLKEFPIIHSDFATPIEDHPINEYLTSSDSTLTPVGLLCNSTCLMTWKVPKENKKSEHFGTAFWNCILCLFGCGSW